MVRSILVGITAALLSWILLVLFTLGWLSWTRSGHLASDQHAGEKTYATIQKEYGDPFELLNQWHRQYDLLILPAISIITGAFVGAACNACPGWVGVVALLPLQLFVLASDRFASAGFFRALIYSLLVYFSASWVARLRRNHSSATASIS